MDYKLISPMQPGLTLLEQILINRGIAQQDLYHFLNVDENDVLDPLLLDNMRLAAQCLIRHISANDKALIIVD